jgi:DNA invertase Pin-like site-specific DNA recombinase
VEHRNSSLRARPTRAAIYARVSTQHQHCDIQLENLRGYVERSGWPATVEFVEKLSGKEGSIP